jgi:hypothetical protein
MPAILCKCSRRISLGAIPCEHEWLFINDVEYDKMTTSPAMPAGGSDPYRSTEEDITDVLYRTMRRFVLCPDCGRLWVYWQGYKQEPQEYMPVKE